MPGPRYSQTFGQPFQPALAVEVNRLAQAHQHVVVLGWTPGGFAVSPRSMSSFERGNIRGFERGEDHRAVLSRNRASIAEMH